MGKIKSKIYDWKNRLQDRHMLSLIVSLIAIIVILGLYIYKKKSEYKQTAENDYNLAFCELVNYVENIDSYLAKATITTSHSEEDEMLTYVWREANLATVYLARLPISTQELENTSKFLNQVSDYSYSLSKKAINGEDLSDEDLKNIENLYTYATDLKNTLNQLSNEIMAGTIKWGDITKKGAVVFATEASNLSLDSFASIEQNFHEYAGLIYDGAYSEHITTIDKHGLTGDNIEQDYAENLVKEIIGNDRIKNIEFNNLSENGNIASYNFSVNLNDGNLITIGISQKGGHLVYINSNKEINQEIISQEDANNYGKEYLKKLGYSNMEPTYYLKQNGIVTINYAYNQDNVTVYPDLIKVKVALDNGEVLGVETTGYLNSHKDRDISKVKVTKEKAKQDLNKNLSLNSEKLAIIPTEWKTEILCWEFSGTINNTDFLVYVNAESGKVEDVLMIVNTPDGTLTR